MIIYKIKRKIYKALHPVAGEMWMLHRVVEHRSDKPEQRDLEVTPHFLEQKLLEYRKRDYDFISIDDLTSLFTTHHSVFTKKFVCLTFDDGYRDNYTLAYPLMKRLEVPFTVYVSTGFIDNHLPMWWYPGESLGISTVELRTMDADPLCTIGAHTVSHPRLDTLPKEQQLAEIKDSKDTLEQLLGHPIVHFSFPHGAHNDDTQAICRQQDFHTVAMAWGGPVRRGASRLLLPRVNIRQNYD